MTNNNTTTEIAHSLGVRPSTVRVEDEGSRRARTRTVNEPVSYAAVHVDHAMPKGWSPKQKIDRETRAIECLVCEEDKVFNHKTGCWE